MYRQLSAITSHFSSANESSRQSDFTQDSGGTKRLNSLFGHFFSRRFLPSRRDIRGYSGAETAQWRLLGRVLRKTQVITRLQPIQRRRQLDSADCRHAVSLVVPIGLPGVTL